MAAVPVLGVQPRPVPNYRVVTPRRWASASTTRAGFITRSSRY